MPVAGVLDWRGIVDLKCLCHLDMLVVDGTVIVPEEEHP
jgi:hypothetical protein